MAANFPPPLTAGQKAERARLAAIDGEAARAEYAAAMTDEAEKTARLRALRLERDRLAAEASEPKAAAAPGRKPRIQRRNIPVR